MIETTDARPGTLCCACGRSIADGERALRFHLPPLVVVMLGAEEHPLAWLYLCCDCTYGAYARFDYGMYHFSLDQEGDSVASDAQAVTTLYPPAGSIFRQICGHCAQPVTGPMQVHEGIGLCPACAAVIAPSRQR